MDNVQLLSIISSFNISPDRSALVALHLNNRGICTGDDALDRGTEITRICHIANIINIVRLGAIESVGDDPVGVFRKYMLDGTDRFFIPYDFIAFYIFNDSCEYEADMVEEAYEDIINTSNTTFFEDQKNEGKPVDEDLKNNIETIFKKIQRHILLAIHQKQYILENIDQAKTDVVKLQSDLESLKNSADDLDEQAKKLEESSKNLKNQADSTSKRLQHATGNYVAILGIFATIIFAVVGGINLFDSAAKYIKLKSEFILYVSTGVLTLSLIIYFLFTWVDRLSGGDKPILPKNPDKWDRAEYCIKKYGFFAFIAGLIVIVAVSILISAIFGEDKLDRNVSSPPYGWVTTVSHDDISSYAEDRVRAMPSSTLRIEGEK